MYFITPNPLWSNCLPICCPQSSMRTGTESTPKFSQPARAGSCGTRGSSWRYSGYVGEDHEEGERSLPGGTGRWSAPPGCMSLTEGQKTRRRRWECGAQWESWRCWAFWGCGRLEVSVSCCRENRALETNDRFTRD